MSGQGDASESVDLCVVGGGAAGLAAAMFAAEADPQLRIDLLDGANTFGAKILVSGGGRCNVTHDVVTAADFFGIRHLVRNILATFPVSETVAWFASLGVELKREETGKLFPVTDKARTVVEALLRRATSLGIHLKPNHRVEDIRRLDASAEADGARFLVRHRQGEVRARQLIVATGGRSLPRTGSDGAGYELLAGLGHRITQTVPALVALRLEDRCFHAALSGLSQEVEVQTVVAGRSADRRTGSLLWTHVGISGPVVMDASRVWCWARARGEAVEVYGNFLPDCTTEQARDWWLARAADHPRRSLLTILAERLPERFAQAICRQAALDPQQAVGQVLRARRDAALTQLTRFPFPLCGDRGWNFAEVTAGGVPLEEIDYRTMASKLVPGLALVGEVLDCDGRIGGFNFQWAWATGRLAGLAAAAACARPHRNS